MNERTYEMYDIDEYFIKFLRIHPYLQYATDNINVKKLNLQTVLLDKYFDKLLTKIQINEIYQNIIDKENQNSIHLHEIELSFKQSLEKIKNNNNINLIDNIDYILNMYSNK